MALPRYRTGCDRVTGRVLSGWRHVEQSVGVILSTQLDARVMRLEFGADLLGQIGRNLTVDRVLKLYKMAVVAVHRWEPEYRIGSLNLVTVERTGVLALQTTGLYYPEGRFGNYDLVETKSGAFALRAAAIGAVS